MQVFSWILRLHRWYNCVLTLSAADCEFKPRSGQTKDYEIDICYFSAKHGALGKILMKINLFSPWYSWKFAKLVFNNIHSLIHYIMIGPGHDFWGTHMLAVYTSTGVITTYHFWSCEFDSRSCTSYNFNG
jgi:hypothetical protein